MDEEKRNQTSAQEIPLIEFTEEEKIKMIEVAKERYEYLMETNVKEKQVVDKKVTTNLYSGKKLRRGIVLGTCVLLISTLVGCAWILYRRSYVNDSILPKLDNMMRHRIPKIEGEIDEMGWVHKKYDSYQQVMKEIGLKLLDTPMAEKSPYTRIGLETNNDTNMKIEIQNYIIGDSQLMEYIESEDTYYFSSGKVYAQPVHLTIEILENNNNGYSVPTEEEIVHDYYGYYKYRGSYVSEQGYKVNVIEATVDDEDYKENIITQKIAIFVADGIKYTVDCCLSEEDMMKVINSMK